MSYILDALRKSETERRQGEVPNLGHQVQLIHRPKKKPVSPIAWLALALIVNAGVMAVVFWPSDNSVAPAVSQPLNAPAAQTSNPNLVVGSTQAQATDENSTDQAVVESGVADSSASSRERPTIIVPQAASNRENPVLREPAPAGRVPHLVELPLSFQKSIPDLTFNSHIFASDPYASRVMINSNYLRQGDSFSGLQVERITQEGVVLSKQGQRFRVGIVRDWVSPR